MIKSMLSELYNQCCSNNAKYKKHDKCHKGLSH